MTDEQQWIYHVVTQRRQDQAVFWELVSCDPYRVGPAAPPMRWFCGFGIPG